MPLTDRESLLHAIDYQRRLLEQYSRLTWSPDHYPSTRNRLTRDDYHRLAGVACRREWELKQELGKLAA